MERKQPESIRAMRRPKGYVSVLSTNMLHMKNPWVTAFWSAMFPGLGSIIMGSYIKGFTLILTSTLILFKSHLLAALVYSLTGQITLAKEILDPQWLLLFAPIYLFSIWGTYRTTVELNKYSILADREDSVIIPIKINSLEINFFDKRNPWVAAAWSFLMPGIGHLYTHRIPTSFFLLTWWIGIAYLARLLPAIHYTLTGLYQQATDLIAAEWFLFLMPIYTFSIYDSYVNTVEYNRLFEMEQSRFLIDNYQDPKFEMPFASSN